MSVQIPFHILPQQILKDCLSQGLHLLERSNPKFHESSIHA
jgi:hypothetical protein